MSLEEQNLGPLALDITTTKSQLLWFDWTAGTWIGLAQLWRTLGPWATLGVGRRVVWLSLVWNPFKSLGKPAPGDQRERLSRHQLRPVLLLHEALQAASIPKQQAEDALRAVVSHSGAAFVAKNIPRIPPPAWLEEHPQEREKLIHRVLARFFNMEADRIQTSAYPLAFDVRRCHFVELCKRLGKLELAPYFCEADSVYFQREESPLALIRPETLAQGHERCQFRLHFRALPDPSEEPLA